MKNTFGNRITMTLFGESHGAAVGCVLDGLPAGIAVCDKEISRKMALRAPADGIGTERREPDEVKILSGVKNGHSEGTPIAILIENKCADGSAYDALSDVPRPGHADFTARARYGTFADTAGGGHFSGRLTAPIVAAGAILSGILLKKGIVIGTHLSALAGIFDREISGKEDLLRLDGLSFPVLDEAAGKRMKEAILTAKAEGDSVGGVLETAVYGLPAGIGEPWFDSLESTLSHALFSIPGIKGIEFGDGFALAGMRGSEANDRYEKSGDTIRPATNHAGGILGGLSSGAPLVFRTAVKPTASIAKEQATVDYHGNEVSLSVKGRHDPAIAPRARAVQDALTTFVLCDLLAARYGEEGLR